MADDKDNKDDNKETISDRAAQVADEMIAHQKAKIAEQNAQAEADAESS